MQTSSEAKIQRAIASINDAAKSEAAHKRSRAFVEVALALGKSHKSQIDVRKILEQSTNLPTLDLVHRAAPTVTVGDFDGIDGRAIQTAFAASLAPGSILDACMRFAKILPPNVNKVLVASGFTGTVTTEGHPRVIADPGLNVEDAVDHSVAAPVIFTESVLNKAGNPAIALFETELRSAIARGVNAEMCAALTTSGDATVTATNDPVADMRAALAKADPSTGYVYVAPGNIIAAMATDPANRGAGVRGGEFVGGVYLVADDDITNPLLIPAGRLVVRDEGLRLSPPARHASVNLSASPTSPSELVSLWQTNCIGLMARRTWRMNANDVKVVEVIA